MITEVNIKEYLKQDDDALSYPQIAQDFYNFIANLDWRYLVNVYPDHIPTLWQTYYNDKLTAQCISDKRSDTERKVQYWDFIYEQIGNAEVREHFTNERGFHYYSDMDQGE